MNHPFRRRSSGPVISSPAVVEPPAVVEDPAGYPAHIDRLAEANAGRRIVNPRPYNSRFDASRLADRRTTTSGGAR